jgi:hypothetical protein
MEGLGFILGAGFAILATLLWLIRKELIAIHNVLSSKESPSLDPKR